MKTLFPLCTRLINRCSLALPVLSDKPFSVFCVSFLSMLSCPFLILHKLVLLYSRVVNCMHLSSVFFSLCFFYTMFVFYKNAHPPYSNICNVPHLFNHKPSSLLFVIHTNLCTVHVLSWLCLLFLAPPSSPLPFSISISESLLFLFSAFLNAIKSPKGVT